MTPRMEQMAFGAILTIASAVVWADWFLPSYITLFFDELIMFALICAARWVSKLRRP